MGRRAVARPKLRWVGARTECRTNDKPARAAAKRVPAQRPDAWRHCVHLVQVAEVDLPDQLAAHRSRRELIVRPVTQAERLQAGPQPAGRCW